MVRALASKTIHSPSKALSRRAAKRPAAAVLAMGGVVALVLALTGPADAGWIWSPATGFYNPKRAVQLTPGELLDAGEKAFAAEKYGDAARYFQLYLQRVKPPAGVATRLRLLEAEFLGRDFDAALDTIQTILDQQPDAQTLATALQRKYEIGYAYLKGAKRYFLGIPVDAGSEGVEILDSIVERYPFQPFADDALYHVATYYYQNHQYQEAELIYGRLVKEYPRSEWVDVAEFQIGMSALHRLKGVGYDITPLDDAEASFQRCKGGDKAEDAMRELQKIKDLRAERLLLIARFYLREEHPESAKIYLLKLLNEHPRSTFADTGRRLLQGLMEGT